ncbi:hypothetical protein C1H46_042718 [Malus baccata]|uniref:Uncharacterized protein n=1 Tax=Malus baccata TaxID=106549 RepID=A0A540KBY9_MALBA|nr:hypothetical protein C1H46_042718 [Malus baccata]
MTCNILFPSQNPKHASQLIGNHPNSNLTHLALTLPNAQYCNATTTTHPCLPKSRKIKRMTRTSTQSLNSTRIALHILPLSALSISSKFCDGKTKIDKFLPKPLTLNPKP